jgi:hypothetical protein
MPAVAPRPPGIDVNEIPALVVPLLDRDADADRSERNEDRDRRDVAQKPSDRIDCGISDGQFQRTIPGLPYGFARGALPRARESPNVGSQSSPATIQFVMCSTGADP